MARQRGRHAAPRKSVVRPAAYATGAVTAGVVALSATDIAGAQTFAAGAFQVADSPVGAVHFAPSVQTNPASLQRAIDQRAQQSTSRSSARAGLQSRADALRAKANSAAALKRLELGVSANNYQQSSTGTDSAAGATSTTSSTPTYSGSPQAIAQAMLSSFGWGQDQFGCLNNLWTKESNWIVGATNPSSGAYGIPQSLPGSKMASAGADWRTNPATQIRWGLGYIKSTYGSPCGAWAHSVATNWY